MEVTCSLDRFSLHLSRGALIIINNLTHTYYIDVFARVDQLALCHLALERTYLTLQAHNVVVAFPLEYSKAVYIEPNTTNGSTIQFPLLKRTKFYVIYNK